MRDEVLAEWRQEKDGPALHVHCHVSGGLVLGSAGWRYAIFRRELPLVLEAFRFGDRQLFEIEPGLDEAPIWIHFHATQPRHNRTESLMDKLGVERAVLVGHSAGGTIAVHTALRHPDRVEALVLVAPAVYHGEGRPGWTRLLLRIPQVRHLGPLLVRSIVARGEGLMNSAWHDPSKITSEIMAGYKKPTQAENWDRALWEFFLASYPLELETQLDSIQMPSLVVTGDDDRWVPTEQSVRLASELPDADLVVIPECDHLPQEEHPELFLQAVSGFLSQLP